MAYESEKSVKLLAKITSRLMSGLLVEEMPLYTFSRHHHSHQHSRQKMCVKSLRTRGVDPQVAELLENIQRMVKLGEIEDAQVGKTSETAYKLNEMHLYRPEPPMPPNHAPSTLQMSSRIVLSTWKRSRGTDPRQRLSSLEVASRFLAKMVQRQGQKTTPNKLPAPRQSATQRT
jgi:hypothetical protein